MSLYEMIDLALSIGNRLDVQIGIFITVHLALFGGIIYVDRPLHRAEKIVTLVVYSLFAFLNYRMMASQLEMMEAIYRQIASIPTESDGLALHFVSTLNSGAFFWKWTMLLVAHVLTFAAVIASVMFDGARQLVATMATGQAGEE